jgi:disulfide bond formation protein DsbB
MNTKIMVTFPELALLAATRGMIGAGVGLLFANRLSRKSRRAVGLPLFIIGALSTIPIALHLFNREQPDREADQIES